MCVHVGICYGVESVCVHISDKGDGVCVCERVCIISGMKCVCCVCVYVCVCNFMHDVECVVCALMN